MKVRKQTTHGCRCLFLGAGPFIDIVIALQAPPPTCWLRPFRLCITLHFFIVDLLNMYSNFVNKYLKRVSCVPQQKKFTLRNSLVLQYSPNGEWRLACVGISIISSSYSGPSVNPCGASMNRTPVMGERFPIAIPLQC